MEIPAVFRDVIAPYINLTIFLLLAYKFFKKPLLGVVAQRKKDYDRVVSEAGKAKEEAMKQQTLLHERLEGLDAEIAKIKDESRNIVEQEISEAKAKAEELGKHIEVEAKRVAEAEVKRVRGEISANIAAQLKSVVESKIISDVSSSNQLDIIKKNCETINSMKLEG